MDFLENIDKELGEIVDKAHRLDTFLSTKDFESMSVDEKVLLVLLVKYMSDYTDTLSNLATFYKQKDEK